MLDLLGAKRGTVANAILVRIAGCGTIVPYPVVDGNSFTNGLYGYESADWADLLEPADYADRYKRCWRTVCWDSSHSIEMGQNLDPRSTISNASWVSRLYESSRVEVTDEHILFMFDSLEVAIYSDIDGLDFSLQTIELRRLAPEFIVGIPRALSPVREYLPSWRKFVLKAWRELSSRPGLDVTELLQGLL